MNNFRISYKNNCLYKLHTIFFICLFSICLYGNSHITHAQNPPENPDDTPLFMKYYDRVLTLEKDGKTAAALAAIPRVSDAEIPIDAFYQTLDKKKRSLLQNLINKSESDMKALYQYYHSLLLRTDISKSVYITYSDLPPERFFYLQIILNNSKDSIGKETFIKSTDPWLAAGVLFLARKTNFNLSPKDVVKYWQKNIYLWDDVCEEQALLYLAGYSVADLKKLSIENEDVRDKINRLKSPQTGIGEVQLFAYSWNHRKPCLNLTVNNGPLKLTLQTIGNYNKILSKKKLKKHTIIDKTLILQPGKYRFKHVEGSMGEHGVYAGTYGQSIIFEVYEKTFIRVFMGIRAGI